MSTITTEEIARLRALCAAAPVPLFVAPDDASRVQYVFYSAAREALPRLLDALEEARRERDALRVALEKALRCAIRSWQSATTARAVRASQTSAARRSEVSGERQARGQHRR